jgi:hypothetical protein
MSHVNFSVLMQLECRNPRCDVVFIHISLLTYPIADTYPALLML